jgi:hypothetical protein
VEVIVKVEHCLFGVIVLCALGAAPAHDKAGNSGAKTDPIAPAKRKLKLKDDAPPEIQDIFKRGEEFRAKRLALVADEIKKVKDNLEYLKKARVIRSKGNAVTYDKLKRPTYTFASAEEKKRALSRQEEVLANREKLLEDTRNEPFTPAPLVTRELVAGAVAEVILEKVRQVVDGRKAIVEMMGTTLDEKTGMIYPSIDEPTQEVWLEGIDTSGMTDGKEINTTMPVRLVGTKTYRTAVGGQRTILKAEPFDITPYLVKE